MIAFTVDAATVRMVALLRASGIRSILLKGGALRQWLYDDGAIRPYGDVDLLVSPDDMARAASVLLDRGWRQSPYPSPIGHADHFSPPAGEAPIPLDLHRTFHYVTVTPERVWELLSARAVAVRLGGHEVETLDEAGLAIIVTLHHVRHGAEVKQTEDLERAIARASVSAWREAAALADQLGARDAFAAGLRDVRGGGELADALGIPVPRDPTLSLALSSAPVSAVALMRLYSARRSPRALKRLVLSEIAPRPIQMHQHYPLARRGRGGLALAYVLRPFRLAPHLAGGVRAVARARRAARVPGRLGLVARTRLAGEILATYLRVRHAARESDVRRVLGRLRDDLRPASAEPDATATRLARATQRVLRLLPADTRCLNQSLVLSVLLARRGIASRVVVGVTNSGEVFGAHAWVEVGGRALLPPGDAGQGRLVEL